MSRGHILQVAFDAALAETRRLLLEKAGFQVTSAVGMAQLQQLANEAEYDLIVVGQIAPRDMRREAILWLKQTHPNARVVALLSAPGERFPEADCEFQTANPEEWVAAVAECVEHP